MGKKVNKKYVDFAAVALGVVAIIMLFLTAVVSKDSEDVAYTGWQAIFGYTEKTEILNSTILTEIFTFSFMNLLTLIFIAGGVVIAVLNAMGKSIPFASFIAGGLLIAGGILFFFMVSFTVPAADVSDSFAMSDYFDLGIGAILGGVFALLAGAAQLCKSLFLK